jgi:hypothetical protein
MAATIHSAMFGAQIATRSPGRSPAAQKARAAARHASASSPKLRFVSPSSSALHPGKRAAAASTARGMVLSSSAMP